MEEETMMNMNEIHFLIHDGGQDTQATPIDVVPVLCKVVVAAGKFLQLFKCRGCCFLEEIKDLRRLEMSIGCCQI